MAVKFTSCTATERHKFLACMACTCKSTAYRARRWAPIRPSSSTILSDAKESAEQLSLPFRSNTRMVTDADNTTKQQCFTAKSKSSAAQPVSPFGSILGKIIIARIFAVSSSRLVCWNVPCNKEHFHDASRQIYKSFGHGSHERYVKLFSKTLDCFTSKKSATYLENLYFSATNLLTMSSVNRLLGRKLTSCCWSTHIVLNDFAALADPTLVQFDDQYWKASSCGKGVPVTNADCETIRQTINEDQAIHITKYEIKHLLCETRQWKIWKTANEDCSKRQENIQQDAVILATYMLRDVVA